MPERRVSRADLAAGLQVVDVLVDSGLATRKADARRGIQGKGFYLNGEGRRSRAPTGGHRRAGGEYVALQKGRKNRAVVSMMLRNAERARSTARLSHRAQSPSAIIRQRDHPRPGSAASSAAALPPACRTRPGPARGRNVRAIARRAGAPIITCPGCRRLCAGGGGSGSRNGPGYGVPRGGGGVRHALPPASPGHSPGQPPGRIPPANPTAGCRPANSSAVSGAIREAGGISRVATTGVGHAPAVEPGDDRLADAERGERFLEIVERRSSGKVRTVALSGGVVVRGVSPEGVLHPVAQLGQDLVGHVLRRLGHEDRCRRPSSGSAAPPARSGRGTPSTRRRTAGGPRRRRTPAWAWAGRPPRAGCGTARPAATS